MATKEEREDAARWAAVEEATELLHEERFREAMVELRGVLEDDPKNAYAYYFLGIAFFEIGSFGIGYSSEHRNWKIVEDR